MTATAPTAMPAIAPAESVEEVVADIGGTGVFDDGVEVTVGETGAVDWLMVLLVVLELAVLVELELVLEAEGYGIWHLISESD